MNKKQAGQIARLIIACEAIQTDAYMDKLPEDEVGLIQDEMDKQGRAVLKRFGLSEVFLDPLKIRDFIVSGRNPTNSEGE